MASKWTTLFCWLFSHMFCMKKNRRTWKLSCCKREKESKEMAYLAIGWFLFASTIFPCQRFFQESRQILKLAFYFKIRNIYSLLETIWTWLVAYQFWSQPIHYANGTIRGRTFLPELGGIFFLYKFFFQKKKILVHIVLSHCQTRSGTDQGLEPYWDHVLRWTGSNMVPNSLPHPQQRKKKGYPVEHNSCINQNHIWNAGQTGCTTRLVFDQVGPILEKSMHAFC